MASQKPSQQSKKSKKSQKPAWATTEKQQEEEKEKEIDELLEFAYELDYDKFMEDQEIRLAFEVIKDRVEEIKKDHDFIALGCDGIFDKMSNSDAVMCVCRFRLQSCPVCSRDAARAQFNAPQAWRDGRCRNDFPTLCSSTRRFAQNKR